MNTAKLNKKSHPATNSFSYANYAEKLAKAKAALQTELRPRRHVTIHHARVFTDHVEVYFFENGFIAKQGKISYFKLAAHVLEVYRSEQANDVTLFAYIEDNLQAVCLSYLEAGKEIVA